ncbi:hypothetical protein BJ322DRAFT_1005819 [Thelephora terrestris]|uniref:C2H2-type domain-containing protein n=1 Tax=Thelephora terrestris TaxID=56493 RepID=A0A9P6HDW8_9AGAM|nr:hypothetical protein BJ322DRAFT_1005819 [Thelephora terrestris]
MSKRHRNNSPSSSPAKTTRIPQSANPFICELPPTCNKHPTTLESASEMESHYSTCHAHVCSAEGCNRIFPEQRFLDLHQTECHNPIAEIKKDRGERIFACFNVNCKSTFTTPKGRRLHLIDKHKYPPNFYFSITNKGIGGLLRRWGEGATLLRKEYTPSKKGTETETTDERHEESSSAIDDDSESEDLTEVRDMDPSPSEPAPSVDVDVLADSMSSLALVPPSVHFGRGGVRGGFKQPPRGMAGRGRVRARGRGRGRGLLA